LHEGQREIFNQPIGEARRREIEVAERIGERGNLYEPIAPSNEKTSKERQIEVPPTPIFCPCLRNSQFKEALKQD
jgi:hypothetical protein